MKRLVFALLLAPVVALASGGGYPLDRAPVNLDDRHSIQRGARIFVNYCLNCHSANYMRYSRMQDLGLSEDQIKDNLVFAGEKVGETMTIAMKKGDAKEWFGAQPPDLSVVARSRGADWLYTYMRGFYRDDSRSTGWNNVVFDKVGMPHVLWQLQGDQVLERAHGGEDQHEVPRLKLVKPGTATPAEYDAMAGDLVNYLVWMGEPAKNFRIQTGIIVIIFLILFAVVAYYLKKEFWKDVH